MMELPLSGIRRDGGTQPRAFTSDLAVREYSEAMEGGIKFPPVVVFYDGTDYWMADGFHRWLAAQMAGFTTIEADIRQGTKEDAQWFSFGANADHGLRRSNADKERAVKSALAHPKSNLLSNYQIAQHCGVSEFMVRKYRESHCDKNAVKVRDYTTKHGTRATMKVGNIGKAKPPAPKRGDTVTFERQGEVREGVLRAQPKNGHAEVWTSETASSFVPVNKLSIVPKEENQNEEQTPPPSPTTTEPVPDPRLALVEQASEEHLRAFARDHLRMFEIWLEEQP